MANPKQRFGKSRTRKRRANWKATAPTLVPCPKCKAMLPPHTVCAECGFYDGHAVVAIAEKE
jgi:large subunit ribosomal protein L32